MDHVEFLKQFADSLAHPDKIFVREKKDGKWGSFSLAEIDEVTAINHVARMLIQGRIPARLID